jgi:hypothetical protein
VSDGDVPDVVEELGPWLAALGGVLGVDVTAVDINAILDLAGEAARGVVRPAAPLTTYVVGMAIAAGADREQAIAAARELAQNWGPAG